LNLVSLQDFSEGKNKMAMSADATQLATLLSVLSQPDTEAIRQAEVSLKPLLKDPRCVPALVEILKAKDTQVSLQIASVLLLGFLFCQRKSLISLTCRILLGPTSASCCWYSSSKALARTLRQV
jgi:HEAT repeat protein